MSLADECPLTLQPSFVIPARDVSPEAWKAILDILAGKPSPPTGDQKEDETST